MARLSKEQSGVMSDDGARVKARRERLGMDKVDLAREAGVSRDTLAAIEEGKGFRRSSLAKIESALTAIELESGISSPVERSQTGDDDVVEFRVEGVLGVHSVVVKGPVRDIKEFENSIARILRQISRPDESDTE